MELRTLPVSFSMCDSSARLSPVSAIRLVQDAASERMQDLGIDELTLKQRYHAIWVLRRNVLRFGTLPAWRTPVRLASGLSLASPAKIWMDTEILLEDGTPVVRGRQELCAIDLDSFAIRRTGTVGVTPELPVQAQLPGLEYSRFDAEGLEPVRDSKVRSLYLDCCGHGNNVELLRFVFNSFPSDYLLDHPAERLEIRYTNQAFEGDSIRVLQSTPGSRMCFALEHGSKRILECLLETKPAL